MISASHNAPIAALDLQPISIKLMHPDAGEGWSPEKTSAVEREYRRFLYLMKFFPEEQTSPTEDVDIFWHYHILDTVKYAVDCAQVFGYFLHHNPYIGLRGAGDELLLQQNGARMRELYEETFGQRYGQYATSYSDAGSAPADRIRQQPSDCAAAATSAFCAAGAANPGDGAAASVSASFCAAAKPAFCAAAKPAFCAAAIASIGNISGTRPGLVKR